jgi:hypothetical protein
VASFLAALPKSFLVTPCNIGWFRAGHGTNKDWSIWRGIC